MAKDLTSDENRVYQCLRAKGYSHEDALSDALDGVTIESAREMRRYVEPLPIHRTEAGYPNCSTCDGGGCLDCTDPA